MTYKELKDFLVTLTEEQLNQTVVVFRDDEEQGEPVDSWDITPEDIYWTYDGDCCGPLDVAKESAKDEDIEWEEAVKDLVMAPAGQVSLYVVTENQ